MCRFAGSLRSKRFRGAKSEERGFWRFARAKNGARAKIRRRECGKGRSKNKKEGVGEGKVPSFPSPLPPSYFCSRPIFRAGKTPKTTEMLATQAILQVAPCSITNK